MVRSAGSVQRDSASLVFRHQRGQPDRDRLEDLVQGQGPGDRADDCEQDQDLHRGGEDHQGGGSLERLVARGRLCECECAKRAKLAVLWAELGLLGMESLLGDVVVAGTPLKGEKICF